MTSEEFNKLKQITENKLKFTDDNIGEKLLTLPYFYHNYLDIYITEKQDLDKLERKKKMLFGKKYHFYKYDYDHKLDTQKEIETYINGDEEYDRVCLEFNNKEIIVNYLVEMLDMIKKMSFTMQSYVKLREFLSGK